MIGEKDFKPGICAVRSSHIRKWRDGFYFDSWNYIDLRRREYWKRRSLKLNKRAGGDLLACEIFLIKMR